MRVEQSKYTELQNQDKQRMTKMLYSVRERFCALINLFPLESDKTTLAKALENYSMYRTKLGWIDREASLDELTYKLKISDGYKTNYTSECLREEFRKYLATPNFDHIKIYRSQDPVVRSSTIIYPIQLFNSEDKNV